jgi:hypothetical protein
MKTILNVLSECDLPLDRYAHKSMSTIRKVHVINTLIIREQDCFIGSSIEFAQNKCLGKLITAVPEVLLLAYIYLFPVDLLTTKVLYVLKQANLVFRRDTFFLLTLSERRSDAFRRQELLRKTWRYQNRNNYIKPFVWGIVSSRNKMIHPRCNSISEEITV